MMTMTRMQINLKVTTQNKTYLTNPCLVNIKQSHGRIGIIATIDTSDTRTLLLKVIKKLAVSKLKINRRMSFRNEMRMKVIEAPLHFTPNLKVLILRNERHCKGCKSDLKMVKININQMKLKKQWKNNEISLNQSTYDTCVKSMKVSQLSISRSIDRIGMRSTITDRNQNMITFEIIILSFKNNNIDITMRKIIQLTHLPSIGNENHKIKLLPKRARTKTFLIMSKCRKCRI